MASRSSSSHCRATENCGAGSVVVVVETVEEVVSSALLVVVDTLVVVELETVVELTTVDEVVELLCSVLVVVVEVLIVVVVDGGVAVQRRRSEEHSPGAPSAADRPTHRAHCSWPTRQSTRVPAASLAHAPGNAIRIGVDAHLRPTRLRALPIVRATVPPRSTPQHVPRASADRMVPAFRPAALQSLNSRKIAWAISPMLRAAACWQAAPRRLPFAPTTAACTLCPNTDAVRSTSVNAAFTEATEGPKSVGERQAFPASAVVRARARASPPPGSPARHWSAVRPPESLV